jgi:Transglycosylase SLT domain
VSAALKLAGTVAPAPLKLVAVCAGAGAMALVALPMGLAALTVRGGAPASAAGSSGGVSAAAQAQIPLEYLRFYRLAGERYGLDWSILAGIGRVECDHGRDPDPSCSREGAVNSAGAGGPMQFLASTWARYGADGDGDGRVDRWDAADAIYGAANYLRASGAPGDYRRAIYAYNHAGWYVAEVEHWAAVYRGSTSGPSGRGESGEGAANGLGGGISTESGAGSVTGDSERLGLASPTAVRFTPGERALLWPANGHIALVPSAAPAVVQAMVVAGNELQELPYGPTGHPDPRGASSEDCSSSVNYILFRSGVRSIAEILQQNPLAQDYVNWGAPGPGRWVSIYATTAPTDHVFIVIAGLRLDTSHTGTDVGPNRGQDGPRWRILDHIPDWAHWSVRHPPGL